MRRLKIFLFIFLVLVVPQGAHCEPIYAGGGDISGGGGDISGGTAGGSQSLRFLAQLISSPSRDVFLPLPASESFRYLAAGVPLPLAPEVQTKSPKDWVEFQRELIGANSIHKLGYMGKGQGIVIIDSGVSAQFASQHKDRILYFQDYTGECSQGQVCDGHSHGTFVTDLILQIAPEAHLVVLKVLNRQAKGDTSDVIEALRWSIKNKEKYNIRVVNLSLTRPDPNYVSGSYNWRDDLMEWVRNARAAGIHVVVCAGNQGETRVHSLPASLPDALTVGSYYHGFDRTKKSIQDSIFSDAGVAVVPHKKITRFFGYENVTLVGGFRSEKPEIYAPGEFVAAQLDLNSDTYQKILLSNRLVKPGVALLSGTSFAGPFVAASMALLSQAYPTKTAEEIRQALTKSRVLDLEKAFAQLGM